MAEHTADTEQFPWSQHAPLTYRRFQLRNNFLLGTKNLVPNPFLIWSFYCIMIVLLPLTAGLFDGSRHVDHHQLLFSVVGLSLAPVEQQLFL